jgi:membrane protein
MFRLGILTDSAKRFYTDDCFSRATGLSFTMLLTLAPLFTLFMVYTPLGDEATIRENAGDILEMVLPHDKSFQLNTLKSVPNAQIEQLRAEIVARLVELAAVGRTLGPIYLITYIITATFLFITIESEIGSTIRESDTRSQTKSFRFDREVRRAIKRHSGTVMKFLIFMMLAPLFTGIFLPITTQLPGFLRIPVHMLIMFLVLVLVYWKMPAIKIRLRDVLAGALAATLLFEILRIGFVYYLNISRSYINYGILATIPLFLTWMFLSWGCVLYGAEIIKVSSIPDKIREEKPSIKLGELAPVLGIMIMQIYMRDSGCNNKIFTASNLSGETGIDSRIIHEALKQLANAGLLIEEQPGNRSYRIGSLDSKKVKDIINACSPKKGLPVLQMLKNVDTDLPVTKLATLSDYPQKKSFIGRLLWR